MSLWKQLVLSVGLVAAAVALSARFLPASHPFLDRAGLLAPLDRLGLVAATPKDDAPPAAGGRPAAGGPGGGGPAAVIARQATPQVMRDIVTSIGTARAVRSVTLRPEVAGRIRTLAVASGDYVTQGSLIAELDSEAARIALDRAGFLVADARATLDRLTRLQRSGSTTETLVQEAELALQTARLEQREAEFALSQHRILAPIDGWVGILATGVGKQVDPGTELTRIEDRSSLLVEFRVPERIVSRLAAGDPVSAAPLADPSLTLAGTIRALDNRVDETSRTLLVQAAIANGEDRLRPGMALRMTLAFTGESHPAVDPLSIQWGAEGAFVWAVRGGKALRLPVRILQRNSDAVLVDGDFRPGDMVVSEGVQALRPGAEVQLAPQDGATPAPKS
ncbi:MAG: efflux RND transporter periplasmic adaptor subunit [Rhodobacter sp.]|nr:efflux RND transporter periplasmic adaptor subunit [Rhodobacter sp.]MCA3511896.1 efflux RND transporter periplasmic adaptor subunit [Rhodobacter sp.]MCA3520836.1 efflux RND transporter periplasmic adaptor subunit [Rhodobacter sp.]MCA3522127.1 efflux RND transporter periplasmic adaptor subunit [Rhodobacter sp.]MCA3527176.1 efflux RND transporter periplasmic adaptor subunit [Rhodobacter sp.]